MLGLSSYQPVDSIGSSTLYSLHTVLKIASDLCYPVPWKSGDICLVQEIREQLVVINKKRKETASMEESPITNTRDNTVEEDAARDWDGTLHWDLQLHPLYKKEHRVCASFSPSVPFSLPSQLD